jgi:hypothetical protein
MSCLSRTPCCAARLGSSHGSSHLSAHPTLAFPTAANRTGSPRRRAPAPRRTAAPTLPLPHPQLRLVPRQLPLQRQYRRLPVLHHAGRNELHILRREGVEGGAGRLADKVAQRLIQRRSRHCTFAAPAF